MDRTLCWPRLPALAVILVYTVSKNPKPVGIAGADGKSGPGCGGCPGAKKCAEAKE